MWRLLIFRCYAKTMLKYMPEYKMFQTKSKLVIASLESPETSAGSETQKQCLCHTHF